MDFAEIYQDALKFGQSLRECYKKGDKNGDGHLSKTELKAALQDYTGEIISKPEMEDYLQEMDPNADGKITYEEFIQGNVLILHFLLLVRIASPSILILIVNQTNLI